VYWPLSYQVKPAVAAPQPDPAALVSLYQEALARREAELGGEHPKVARAASDLGLYLRKLGRDTEALGYLRRTLDIDARSLRADDPVLAQDLENVASLVPPNEAVELLARAAECRDPQIAARVLGKLAALQDGSAAIATYRRALANEEAASGPVHPRVAVRLNDLALKLKPDEAEPLFRRALAIQTDALGPKHPETATTGNNLAGVLLGLKRFEEAERVQRDALKALEASLGGAHARVAIACSNLADILLAKRDFQAAIALYRRALAIDERVYGPKHPEVARDRANLTEALRQAKGIK
jgi:tetratricopeptide (TPR) repeat protein